MAHGRTHKDGVRAPGAPGRLKQARAGIPACSLGTCDVLAHDPAAVCVIAAGDLTVAYANPACLDLVKSAAQDARGRPISELLPAGCEALVDLFRAARDAGTAASLSHFRWACSSGDEQVWSVGLAPRLDAQTGQVAELVVFISDVTEHGKLVRSADQAAERERRRAEQLDAVFASIASALMLTDREGGIRKCNAAAASLFDLGDRGDVSIDSPELSLRRSDGGEWAAQESPLARALRGEMVRGEEAVIQRPGRPQRNVSVTAAPVIADGEVTGAVAVFHDISEMRDAEERMERALQGERQRAREARTLYHAARTISSDLNLQECLNIVAGTMAEAVGVSRCHIVLLDQETPTGVAAFGVSPEHVKRLEARVLGPAGLSARSRQVIEERRPAWVEETAADPFTDQERTRGINMKSALIVPLIYGSRVTGLAYLDEPGAAHEFSESNRAMAMAIGAQAAVAMENARLYQVEQERARMLEFMMAELNHRVKNNLAIVCGLLALQLTQADPAATKESILRDCMTRIQSISLIQQILHEENMDAVDMKETARRIAAMACDTLAAPGQRITYRVRGDDLILPCKLATSLGVAINELICNAVKHGFAGRAHGNITVRISVARSPGDRHPGPQGLGARDRIRISVGDDGRGLAQAFDALRDGHVGVTVVSGLVEGELGGSFALCNRARGGATAVLVFPASALSPRG